MKTKIESIKAFVKKSIKKLLFLFPSRLPVGMTEFDTWAASIIEAYDMPNNDSIKFALASMIPYVSSESKIEINLLVIKLNISSCAYKSKHFFGQALQKSASNQVAGGIMQELKQKQAEMIAKEAAEKEQAVTTSAVEA